MLLRAIRDSRGTRDALSDKGLRVSCVLQDGGYENSNAREFQPGVVGAFVADRWQIVAGPGTTETYGRRAGVSVSSE